MEKAKGLSDWIPLISKLVWPVFIFVGLLIFQNQVRDIYDMVIDGAESGRSVEFGGFLKLGAAASSTKIETLSNAELSIRGVGGAGGVARKGSASQLGTLQKDLQENPQKSINTLLLSNDVRFSIKLMKQYISTLGLRFVVFQKDDKFDGWISVSSFVAQLPKEQDLIDYPELREELLIGINTETANPGDSAKAVLTQMQELHVDSIPVVDADQRWLFFANRGEILARLITAIIVDEEIPET
jgi:CBS domain-containing protein